MDRLGSLPVGGPTGLFGTRQPEVEGIAPPTQAEGGQEGREGPSAEPVVDPTDLEEDPPELRHQDPTVAAVAHIPRSTVGESIGSQPEQPGRMPPTPLPYLAMSAF